MGISKYPPHVISDTYLPVFVWIESVLEELDLVAAACGRSFFTFGRNSFVRLYVRVYVRPSTTPPKWPPWVTNALKNKVFWTGQSFTTFWALFRALEIVFKTSTKFGIYRGFQSELRADFLRIGMLRPRSFQCISSHTVIRNIASQNGKKLSGPRKHPTRTRLPKNVCFTTFWTLFWAREII